MNKRAMLVALAMQFFSSVGYADTVVKALPDTLPGSGAGGLSGFMVGAVAGPVGAVVGAGMGWLIGGETQKVSGLGGDAYQVRRDDGTLVVVRSPNRSWSPGDRVDLVNGRLHAADTSNGSVEMLGANSVGL